jgi:hypothetical protein
MVRFDMCFTQRPALGTEGWPVAACVWHSGTCAYALHCPVQQGSHVVVAQGCPASIHMADTQAPAATLSGGTLAALSYVLSLLCLPSRARCLHIYTHGMAARLACCRATQAGRTPLWAACDEGHTEVVEELLRCPGIDVEADDEVTVGCTRMCSGHTGPSRCLSTCVVGGGLVDSFKSHDTQSDLACRWCDHGVNSTRAVVCTGRCVMLQIIATSAVLAWCTSSTGGDDCMAYVGV